MPRRRVSGSAVVFALLVLATVAAFAWSQHVKRAPLVLDRVTFVAVPRADGARPTHSFTPNGDCRYDRMRIRFRTTVSDHGTVQVVRPGGALVLTLARDRYLKRYHFHTFYWDGRARTPTTRSAVGYPQITGITHSGTRGEVIAPPGRYKLRVKLLGEERSLVPPGAIRLHRAPRNPTLHCAAAAAARGAH
jgi:hypothetical protein